VTAPPAETSVASAMLASSEVASATAGNNASTVVVTLVGESICSDLTAPHAATLGPSAINKSSDVTVAAAGSGSASAMLPPSIAGSSSRSTAALPGCSTSLASSLSCVPSRTEASPSVTPNASALVPSSVEESQCSELTAPHGATPRVSTMATSCDVASAVADAGSVSTTLSLSIAESPWKAQEETAACSTGCSSSIPCTTSKASTMVLSSVAVSSWVDW